MGRAIAVGLARAGYDVVVTTRNPGSDDARLATGEMEAAGAGVDVLEMDPADEASVEVAAKQVLAMHRPIDGLVHNASAYEQSPLEELSAGKIRRDLDVHVLAPLLLTARLAPALGRSEARGGSCVLCMCDIHAADRPRKKFASYAASKAGLAQLVANLAVDLAPRTRVLGLAPGVVAWPDEGFEADREMQRRYLKRVPLGRAGTPEEAAHAAVFLMREATYLTGQVIRIDGGRWLG